MKVYVIEAGVYSDRHIVAVTLNKEDAYKLRDAAMILKDTEVRFTVETNG